MRTNEDETVVLPSFDQSDMTPYAMYIAIMLLVDTVALILHAMSMHYLGATPVPAWMALSLCGAVAVCSFTSSLIFVRKLRHGPDPVLG